MATVRPVLVFDASVLLAWVLQAQGQWVKVERLLDGSAHCLMPAAALAETIYVARHKGNTAAPADIRQALVAQGLSVEPLIEEDAVQAGHLIAESRIHPAPEGTLSLGDGLVLATAMRLNAVAVTFDSAWWNFPTLSASWKLLNPWKVPD